MAAVFAVCAYLSLVNLDWATLWDDEAISAQLARNHAAFGELRADDGRNIYSPSGRERADASRNSSEIKPDGTVYYPPLMPWLTGMVFRVFGAGDAQARMLSALMTLAAMALFALILRREFARAPWLAAAAFALACLSPLVLGYARSATYNAPLLLAHTAVFWAYLHLCARPRVWHAVALAAAAIAGFHAHYLSNLLFMGALGGMHLLCRRREFNRRAWALSAGAAGAYAAQLIWLLAAEDIGGGYGMHAPVWSRLPPTLWWEFFQLSYDGMLAWGVALWLLLWRALAWARDSQPPFWKEARPAFFARREWTPDDAATARAAHYMALTLFGALLLALAKTMVDYAAARFLSSFAPFALVAAAAAAHWAWRRARIAGLALGATLLLSNAAGWPMLSGGAHQANLPRWTLPALALEYHRDFPDLQREALDYIRENVPKDSVVFVDYGQCGWTVFLWELSDHVRMCCSLNRPAQWADTRGREYLFRPRVLSGEVVPDYLFLIGPARFYPSVTLSERAYQRVADFPSPIFNLHGGCSPGRPEPGFRNPRPDRIKDRARRAHLYQLERP
ncbi:MAG: glycosyltransferase family 39 protein [Gammaproteobacteria bacterium]|nr:glycosyltransferase family 39 protein [Gammaproteobacteria bacterium]